MAEKPLPPVEHRFKPGISPNPKGRPKGSKNKRTKMRTPALDEMVRFPVDGAVRRMKLREAIIRLAIKRAWALQDPKLMKLLSDSYLKLKEAEAAVDYDDVLRVIMPGPSYRIQNVEWMAIRLGLAKLIYRDHPAQRPALKPEAVMQALSGLGDRRLTRDEQKLVVSFTLTPWKVQWPEWWEDDLRTRKCRVPARFLAEDDAEWKRALAPLPR